MQNTLKIPAQDGDQWNVIIETPKASRNKYKFDTKTGIYELGQVLPEGMTFPYDFGFLPSTLGADGDPLDVLLLNDQPTFPGCLVPSKLVGVIEAEQTKDGKTNRNDRLVAVPLTTRRYGDLKSAKDLDECTMREIEGFFSAYNRQLKRKFQVLGLHGPKRAKALVQDGIKAFSKKHRGKR